MVGSDEFPFGALPNFRGKLLAVSFRVRVGKYTIHELHECYRVICAIGSINSHWFP